MLLEHKIKEAFEKKKNDIRNYIWKGPKVKNSDGKFVQETVRLVDCPIDELKKYYNYCEEMLYNTNSKNPGRKTLLEIIQDQSDRCNTELFLRWQSKNLGISRFQFFNTNKELYKNGLTLSFVVENCPGDYAKIPLALALDGCLDTLGIFNRKHLTTTFLLQIGVWPTDEERAEFEKNKLPLNSENILKYLEIDNSKHIYKIRLNSKGIPSLKRMKSVTSLKLKKYSEMSNVQLETLRDKILPRLEHKVKFHVKQWEERQDQIRKVLEHKGCQVN